MLINKSYKTELDPTKAQISSFVQHAGAARFAWNWALGLCKEEYSATGVQKWAIERHKQLVQLKNSGELGWLKEVSKWAPQVALRNLDEAYRHTFRRLKSGDKPGFPKFKSKHRSRKSFAVWGYKVEGGRIKLPRIGWVRLKEKDYIPTYLGESVHFLSATISETAGRWYVSVCVREEFTVEEPTGASLGIDLGIKTLATVSDGRKFENPRSLQQGAKRIRRANQTVARRKKGSNNRKKAIHVLQRAYQKVSAVRRDNISKVVATLLAIAKPATERPRAIVLEDLHVKGMLKNRRLAKAVADASMSMLRQCLTYKAQWYRVELIEADRFFPSSKMCHSCGTINEELKLKEREWTCVCGVSHDRDVNAAINLRDWIRPDRPESPQRLRRSCKTGA